MRKLKTLRSNTKGAYWSEVEITSKKGERNRAWVRGRQRGEACPKKDQLSLILQSGWWIKKGFTV